MILQAFRSEMVHILLHNLLTETETALIFFNNIPASLVMRYTVPVCSVLSLG